MPNFKSQNFKMPKKVVRESSIESYLFRQCKKRGWLCEKFTSPNKRSVPDRIITAHGDTIVFVECKAPGKIPTPLQQKDHERRRGFGCTVMVVDSKASVDNHIRAIEIIIANGR